MKLIQCIIRPEKLPDLVERIEGMASGITVSEVRGHGHQKGQPAIYRGLEYQITLLPKTRVEIVAEDSKDAGGARRVPILPRPRGPDRSATDVSLS